MTVVEVMGINTCDMRDMHHTLPYLEKPSQQDNAVVLHSVKFDGQDQEQKGNQQIPSYDIYLHRPTQQVQVVKRKGYTLRGSPDCNAGGLRRTAQALMVLRGK